MILYKEKRINAVIFDMDRLLVETSAVWERPAQGLMSELGLDWSVDISRHYRGMDATDVVKTIFRLFKPDVPIEKCHAIYRNALLEAFASAEIKMMPGADAIFEYLHGKVKMTIASGSPPEGIEEVLNRFGWHNYFDLTVSSENVGSGRGKPFPDVFIATAESIGTAPSCCLVLEDALAGVKAALSAGMHCVAVPTADAEEMHKLGVETFGTLSDVIPVLHLPVTTTGI
jgi:HAD superfamily hydrolase (TIGR01509 family)